MSISFSQRINQDRVDVLTPRSRLLAVGERKRSGLILCKPHFAEFAGPGAAIGSAAESGYTSVLAIGDPDIVELVSHEERQKAYGLRIQWIRWSHQILSQSDSAQRLEKLFAGFEEFFGSETLAHIPDHALALLAGVLPQTVSLARSQNQSFGKSDQSCRNPAPEGLDISITHLGWQNLQPAQLRAISVVKCLPFPESSQSFPCSA